MALGAAAPRPPAIRSAEAQTKTLVIGGSVPLTGAAAETGLNVNNGYITAVSYINDVLGGVEIAGDKYKIDLKLFDDASDPARATTLIQRQIDEGTNFFLGSFGSNIVLPTAAITERAKKPMVQTGGGSDAIFTKGYKYIFGMFPRATRQFAARPAMFKSLQPLPQTYSVVWTNDAFSKTAAEGVRPLVRRGGLQAHRGLRAAGQADRRVERAGLGAIHQSGPAGLRHARPELAPGGAPDGRHQHQREAAVPGVGPQLASFREALGKHSDYLCCSTYWDENVAFKDKFFGDSKKFVEYYKTKFTRPIAYHAGRCCLHRDLHPRHAGGQEHQSRSGARRLAKADYETFYSRIKFTPEGDGDEPLMGGMIGQVQKGKLEIVFPAAGASAKPPIRRRPGTRRRDVGARHSSGATSCL